MFYNLQLTTCIRPQDHLPIRATTRPQNLTFDDLQSTIYDLRFWIKKLFSYPNFIVERSRNNFHTCLLVRSPGR